MPLTVDQAKNKTDVFNEIKTQKATNSLGKPRYWREDWFTFQSPKQVWIDGLKDKNGTLQLKLEYVGDREGTGGIKIQQPGKFTVRLQGVAKDGKTVMTSVGVIQEEFK